MAIKLNVPAIGGSGGQPADPIIPADGIQDITGNLQTTGDIYVGSSLGIGTVVPGSPFELVSDGITDTTSGFHIRNTTAATAGVQQYSPSIKFEGQGWDGSASASVDGIVQLTPVASTTGVSSGWLKFAADPSGAGIWTDMESGAVHVVGTSVDGPLATDTPGGERAWFSVFPGARTNMTVGNEAPGASFRFDLSSKQWDTGAVALQREMIINAPTYSFVGASTITDASTVFISGAPIAGTNATITSARALHVSTGDVLFGTTVSGLDWDSTDSVLTTAGSFGGKLGSVAPVAPSNEGRLRYNESTQKWQFSENTGAYADAFGAGGLTIGDSITGGGGTRILYESGGNTLTQDANFTWSGLTLVAGLSTSAGPKISIGTGQNQLTLEYDVSGDPWIYRGANAAYRMGWDNGVCELHGTQVQLNPTGGGGAIAESGFFRPDGGNVVELGKSSRYWKIGWITTINSSTINSPILNASSLIDLSGTGRIDFDADNDTSLRSSSDDIITFEVGAADVLEVGGGGTTAYLEMGLGQTAAVSAANKGRLRYNESIQKFQISENTGAYSDLAVSSATFELGGADEIDGNKLSASLGTLTNDSIITPDVNADGTVWVVTLSGAHTMDAPLNTDPGMSFLLKLEQDSTGSRTVAWNSAYKWSGGTAPTLTTTASGIDIISGVTDGTDVYCSFILDVR